MKLFTINKDGKLIPYKEQIFKEDNKESDLENLLERNPEYFFEASKIMIIGRQVPTNLGSWIDLLGLDRNGNTVVIELKRGKTPRETVAQLLEYASFIENLDYEALNEIYQGYIGEETSLDNYLQEYFEITNDDKVSFNKNTKLVIVAQDISNHIKQTSLYLRKKGLDIYCMEFKYFQNNAFERMITSDFVVGEENFIKSEVKSTAQLPKVDEKTFLESLDKNGKVVFEKIFEFAKSNDLFLRWGSKGFSLNLPIENGFVGLCFGYPPDSVFKQSIYSGIEEITKKVNDYESIVEYYKKALEKTGFFEPAKSNLKWVINKSVDNDRIMGFLNVLTELVSKIKEKGLK
jgi:predicted DNA-binding protein YlxM (UPF0122 family)